MEIIKLFISLSIFLVFSIVCSAQTITKEDEKFTLVNAKGLYATSNGWTIIINPNKEFTCFTIIETGETHAIRKTDIGFEFSETRSSFDRIGGTLEFNFSKQSITVLFKSGLRLVGNKKRLTVTQNIYNINDSVSIAGEYIEPSQFTSRSVAVLLQGDGRNDRYDLYDIGMHLVHRGIAIFIFDKRNTGESSGPKIKGNNYDVISRQESNDIIGLLKALQNDSQFSRKKIGVVGHSQGGWLGSIASANIPEVAFYVNIAGNVSDGWKQFRHYSICLLKRSGFTLTDLNEAEEYINLYFDYYLNKVEKEKLISSRNSFEGRSWIKFLESKKSGFRLGEVKRMDEEPPRKEASEDLKGVQCPSLGVFFEFDHSSPPETPIDFLNGILQSKNRNVTVKVFPKANHGMWGVSGYSFNSNDITSRDPMIFNFICDWILAL